MKATRFSLNGLVMKCHSEAHGLKRNGLIPLRLLPFLNFFTLLHLLSEVFRVLPRLANPFT